MTTHERFKSQFGFTLLEMLCVIAILAIIASLSIPVLPRGTSRARLEAYAMEAAALLKADRNSALRGHMVIATEINTRSRFLRSGSGGRTVRVPDDVRLEALLTVRCNGSAIGQVIAFYPSGMSCGGVIAMSRSGVGYQVRVNWLTGGIDVVPLEQI